jgi:hypothetical protein
MMKNRKRYDYNGMVLEDATEREKSWIEIRYLTVRPDHKPKEGVLDANPAVDQVAVKWSVVCFKVKIA